MAESRTRETNDGMQRHNLYASVLAKRKKAMEDGYYLEAVTLTESIVADRLESRLSFLKGEDFSFKPLGPLIIEAGKVETDEELKALVTDEENGLEAWRKRRNNAIHELAKIEEDSSVPWGARYEEVRQCAESGYELFRKINARVNKLRREGQKQEAK